MTPALTLRFSTPAPTDLEGLMALVKSQGKRFVWAWREDLGSGKSDDVSCVVIVEGCPEYDALCLQYQDHLQAVVPFSEEECLGSAFGLE